MKKVTAEWLKSAQMDLENIAHIANVEDLTPIAAFHAQQCVEKCFKSLLEEHSNRVPKEHSTLKLYGLIKGLIPLEVDMDILTDLDDLYIDARYPGDFGLLPNGKPTLVDTRQFYDFAKEIYEQITNILSEPDKE